MFSRNPDVTQSRINRRRFCSALTLASLSSSIAPLRGHDERQVDVVIIGGGLGGCAAAIAALRNGSRVVMTELSDWIGGQLTSQGVPPDEHRWIETSGANASYRELRSRIRDYYRQHYPLIESARIDPTLNPGRGSVSRLCCEPRVPLAVLNDWLAPLVASGQLTLLLNHEPVTADLIGDQVRAVTVRHIETGDETTLKGHYFIDATELGDLLPITETEFVTGSESKADTGELHAGDSTRPDNQQAFTMCFAVDYLHGENHTIDRPESYGFWREFVPKLDPPWPGRLLDFTYTHPRSGAPKRLGFDPLGGSSSGGALNLWRYRRIIDASLFQPGRFDGDISLTNWPQNDYFLGNLVGVSAEDAAAHVNRAKQLSLSLLYWLQTEAPRPDGGIGFPGLRLRADVMGTEDGLAKMPYVRESRRIKAVFTVLEQHVGRHNRSLETGTAIEDVRAAAFEDSVGVGSYPIDLHPSTGGDNYVDFESLPFQIPLGVLLPQRVRNLLPANKNIGTTHITSGCYRLHPVEWGIGEAAGCLASHAITHRRSPHEIRSNRTHFDEFQASLHRQGVQTSWDH